MLKETVKIKGALRTKAVIECLDTNKKTDKKSLNRLKIQEQVFDNADSIADNAKMISLLFSLISRIYNILDDTQKDKLDENDRNMIEYTIDKFKNTQTRADVQFTNEGLKLVDKLMDRQASIASIIS